VIAVAPAVAEELIFRGLIGRGLIGRWGVVWGVLTTSVLFGAMHVNPAQGVAVIPLGMAMHFAYLTTRSFWAPMLLHLLNNAFAAVMLKYGDEFQIARALDNTAGAPLPLLAVSAAMLVPIGLMLWQTRVRLTLADGELLSEAWHASEHPSDGNVVRVSQPPRLLLIACGIGNCLGFLFVLWKLATGAYRPAARRGSPGRMPPGERRGVSPPVLPSTAPPPDTSRNSRCQAPAWRRIFRSSRFAPLVDRHAPLPARRHHEYQPEAPANACRRGS
jgi:Type II CAAX prenyl endopeptidase Rce1-like